MSDYSNFTKTTTLTTTLPATYTTVSVTTPDGYSATISGEIVDMGDLAGLADLFRRLAIAVGHRPEAVEEYLGEFD